MSNARLVLVDGSSYFYRAFHALPPLINSKGQPTGAMYGVVNMIKKLLKTYAASQFAIIFDTPAKTFRDELYPEYKAHRPPTPSDLKVQFEPLVTLLKAMGLPVVMIDGVEADDVIGTLAQQATAEGFSVLISTGDKDMAQLVNEKITLINTMTNQILDEQSVQEKFGAKPTQIVDYLCLVGDTSDNVPGVHKCGPKTAVKWLSTYQTVDNVIQNVTAISGKIQESLQAFIPKLPLTKQLVTIKTDVPLPFHFSSLVIQPADIAQLRALFTALEFKSWLKELSNDDTATEPPKTDALTEIQISFDELKTLLNHPPAQLVSLYFEFEHEDLKKLYIAFDELTEYQYFVSDNASNRQLTDLLFQNDQIIYVTYDLKKVLRTLKLNPLVSVKQFYDVLLAAYVINSTTVPKNYLDLVELYLGNKEIKPSIGLLKLHKILNEKLTPSLKSLFSEIEMPLLFILAKMEMKGVLLDPIQLATQGERLNVILEKLKTEAYALAQRPFNLNSPKQLLEILYDELKLPILAKTPTGQPSTNESVLQDLAKDYRLPAVILEHRSLNKLMSTYIEALPKHMDAQTQRVHTTFNQALTSTGRLSSSDPNLQNIPIKHPEGRLIRKAFIAPPGYLLLTADYSQIELRLMAHLSKDPALQHAFKQSLDVHQATASEIFNVPLNAVTSDQRRRAKAVNFGLIYGMSSFGLAKQLNISQQEAKHYIQRYFERYPQVFHFMEETRRAAKSTGFVETIFGRKLYIPGITSQNKQIQKAAERMAINAPLQGSAADLIKKAMIQLQTWQFEHMQPQDMALVLQVHDELIFEVKIDKLTQAKAAIQQYMEQVIQLDVPLVVSIGTGQNWDEAH